jgi:hypothetical protein
MVGGGGLGEFGPKQTKVPGFLRDEAPRLHRTSSPRTQRGLVHSEGHKPTTNPRKRKIVCSLNFSSKSRPTDFNALGFATTSHHESTNTHPQPWPQLRASSASARRRPLPLSPTARLVLPPSDAKEVERRKKRRRIEEAREDKLEEKRWTRQASRSWMGTRSDSGDHQGITEWHADGIFKSQSGNGLIKVNGRPLSLVQPEVLRFKVRTQRNIFISPDAHQQARADAVLHPRKARFPIPTRHRHA